jgi:hypothetical protein
MMDISPAGLLGAVVGTAIAGLAYHLFIGVLERWVSEGEPARTTEERDSMDVKLSLMRRIVLTVDLFLFAAAGYWIGQTYWG